MLVESIDALLMPVTLAFVYLLATGPALPPEVRVRGWHKWTALSCFVVVTLVAWVAFVWGIVASGGSQHHHNLMDVRPREGGRPEMSELRPPAAGFAGSTPSMGGVLVPHAGPFGPRQ